MKLATILMRRGLKKATLKIGKLKTFLKKFCRHVATGSESDRNGKKLLIIQTKISGLSKSRKIKRTQLKNSKAYLEEIILHHN